MKLLKKIVLCVKVFFSAWKAHDLKTAIGFLKFTLACDPTQKEYK